MILGINIKHFEALYDLKLGLSREQLIEAKAESADQADGARVLAELTGIIGENNVGKSSFFRALEFFRSGLIQGFHIAATEGKSFGFSQLMSHDARGNMSFDLICYAVDLKKILIYYIEIQKDKHGRPRICQERVEGISLSETEAERMFETGRYQPVSQPLELYLDLKNGQGQVFDGDELRATRLSDRKLAGLHVYGNLLQYQEISWIYRYIHTWYFCHISDQTDNELLTKDQQKNRLQLESGNGEHHRLNPDGSNIVNVMAYHKRNNPQVYRQVVDEIEKLLPNAKEIYARIRAATASGSEQKLFGLFLLLLSPEPRRVIFIENPDHGLYYSMVDELAALMRSYSFHESKLQIIFSTHSQNLVESLSPDELWILFRDERLGAGSHIMNADKLPFVRQMYDEGIGLSSLWYAGHFDPLNFLTNNEDGE